MSLSTVWERIARLEQSELDNAFEARRVAERIRDPELRRLAFQIEARSMLFVSLLRALRDYIEYRYRLEGLAGEAAVAGEPRGEDLELGIRIVSEFLSRESRLRQELVEIADSVKDGDVAGIVRMMITSINRQAETLSALRAELEKALAEIHGRFKPEAQE